MNDKIVFNSSEIPKFCPTFAYRQQEESKEATEMKEIEKKEKEEGDEKKDEEKKEGEEDDSGEGKKESDGGEGKKEGSDDKEGETKEGGEDDDDDDDDEEEEEEEKQVRVSPNRICSLRKSDRYLIDNKSSGGKEEGKGAWILLQPEADEPVRQEAAQGARSRGRCGCAC